MPSFYAEETETWRRECKLPRGPCESVRGQDSAQAVGLPTHTSGTPPSQVILSPLHPWGASSRRTQVQISASHFQGQDPDTAEWFLSLPSLILIAGNTCQTVFIVTTRTECLLLARPSVKHISAFSLLAILQRRLCYSGVRAEASSSEAQKAPVTCLW